MAVKEFVSTGKSSYRFSLDQGASGPAFQALFEKKRGCMEKGNLLGGERQDAYEDVSGWIRAMDHYLHSFSIETLRPTSKACARGGIYEGGVRPMAFHVLGLDPDKMEQLDAADLLFLEDRIELPEYFRKHPTFLPLMEGERFAQGVVFDDIIGASKSWCRGVGYKALHEGIPTIRPLAKRLRDANAISIRETGRMLSWTFPIGGTVYKVPWSVSQTKTHKVKVSYKGNKGYAVLQDVEYNQDQNCSADLVHYADGCVRGETVIGCKRERLPVTSNHDGFSLHAANIMKIQRIWRNAFIHVLWDAGFEDTCVGTPKGMHHNDLLRLIPEDIVTLF